MSVIVTDFEAIDARASSVIAHWCDRLKVVEYINERVKWDPVRAEMSPGEAIKALVINLLVKRAPLYRVDEFYAKMDIANLFGTAWQAEDFHDDRLGAALEKLAKGDLPGIYHAIAWEAFESEGILLDQVHVDTTSLSVEGAYERSALEDSVLRIDYGHSKERRPDLKQFMFGLGSVEGLPLFADVMNGNTSDKTWNGAFAVRMSELLPPDKLKNMITIADSAMVTEDNLRLYGDRPFISRFPETYSLCKELKDLAYANEANWVNIGRLTEGKNGATYRLQGMESELYGRTYRFAVVHSSALDQRKQHKIDRDIAKERSALEKSIQGWNKTAYHCEQDAAAALPQLLATRCKYHKLSGKVVRLDTVKRRRGRPTKGEELPVEVSYHCQVTVQPDAVRIQRAREQESTFVLISNVAHEREPSVRGLLQRYKSQIEVENLFRALKHPYFVHGIFLQKETRILGLSYVFVIGLLIYALLQRRIRIKIKEEQTPLRLYGKDFYSPTGKTILEQFEQVIVIDYWDADSGKRKKFVKISETAKLLLRWLGLDETIYLTRSGAG